MSRPKSGLSQKEYLQQYLKKTKKKKPKSLESRGRKNVKIIDDDEYQFGPNDNYYGEEDEEDAPVVAAIIDERPREISQMERYQMSGNWKKLDGASPPPMSASPPRKRPTSGKHKRAHKRDIPTDEPVGGSFKGASKAGHRHEGPLIDDDGRRYRDSVSPSRDFQVDKEERRYRREGRAESPRYRNGGDRRSPVYESEQRHRDRRSPPDDSRYQEPRMRAVPERRYRDESPRRSRHHWTEPTEVDPSSPPPPKERKRDFGFLTRKPIDQMREKRRSESPPPPRDDRKRLSDELQKDGWSSRRRDKRRSESPPPRDDRKRQSDELRRDRSSSRRRDKRRSESPPPRDDRKRQSDELQRDRSSSRRRDDRRGRRKETSVERHSNIRSKGRFEASAESTVSRKHDQRWPEEPIRARDSADRDSRQRKRREETSPDRGLRSSRGDERRRDVHSSEHEDSRRRDSSPQPVHSSKHDRKQRDGSADRYSRSKPDERRRREVDEERRRKITPPPASRSSKHDRKQKDASPSPPASKNRQRDISPDLRKHDERNRHRIDAEPARHSHKKRSKERSANRNDSPAKEHRRKKDDVDSPPPTKRRRDADNNEQREKSSKFSEYGLVNSKSKNYETQEKRTDEGSGKNAATIYRDRKTGKIRDFESEKLEKIEKRRKEDEKMKQYHEWGKGLKQVEDEKVKKAADEYEMTKPLARYANDNDLEEHLKQKEIEGLDPMLEYLNSKKKKKQSKDGNVTKMYKGSYPMNRFNIRPGHRWDGVDRSNGFEKEWFTKQNELKARQEEAWKWSSADM